jgi:hypothetical protein
VSDPSLCLSRQNHRGFSPKNRCGLPVRNRSPEEPGKPVHALVAPKAGKAGPRPEGRPGPKSNNKPRTTRCEVTTGQRCAKKKAPGGGRDFRPETGHTPTKEEEASENARKAVTRPSRGGRPGGEALFGPPLQSGGVYCRIAVTTLTRLRGLESLEQLRLVPGVAWAEPLDHRVVRYV